MEKKEEMEFSRAVPGKQKIAFGKISLAAPLTSGSPGAPPTSSSTTASEIAAAVEREEQHVGSDGGGGFGSFSFKPAVKGGQVSEVLSPEEAEVKEMMGFSGFGTSRKVLEKTAKTFDVKEMVEAIKKAKKLQVEKKKAVDSSADEEEEETTDKTIQIDEQSIKLARLAQLKAEKKRLKASKVVNEEDTEVVGPMPPPPLGYAGVVDGQIKTTGNDSDDSGSSDSSESDEEERDADADSDSDGEAVKKFPLEHQMDLEHGVRPVTALSVDPTATRFATGSLDYEVKMWDFTGLRNRHAFRSTKPCENHPIKHVSFSANGEAVLVISGSAQAKVLNRDGSELLECIKGDQYIVDMSRTKGHVSALTGGSFHPKDKSVFMTSSDDSTVRLWDVENSRTHRTLVKLKSQGGLKTRVTACCFSRDGACFMGAGADGTICMWDTRKPLVVPTASIRNAHEKNTDIFHVVYSNSGLQVASRGEDGVVNIFDSRNWKKPIHKTDKLKHPAKHFTTDLCFSPDDRHLLIPSLPPGMSARAKDETVPHSSLYFFSTKTLTYAKEHIFLNQMVIRTAWHHRINQILVTFASGSFGILYDTDKSQRGALLAHGKGPKKHKAMGVVEDMHGKVVITPNSLPLYKVERTKNPKREEAKMRADPVKSKRPDLPITAGSGGRVAASGSTLSSYVIRNLGLSKSVKDDMDPREAILKFAKDAEENPIWVTPAYKKTQPKPIFEATKEEEAPDPKKPRLL